MSVNRSLSATGPLGSRASMKTMQKTLSKSVPLEIFPPEILFKDIELDQTYEVTVSVRNLCSNVRRIRFVPPKTSKFIAEYETLGSIAGGIQTKVVISFETDMLGDFHDEMTIISEDFTYKLLMHAYQPAPSITFDALLNLGLTPVNQSISGSVHFKNEGSRSGTVNLRYDKTISPELLVGPETFVLNPNSEIQVDFKYSPKEVGVFRCPVEVEVEGSDTIRHIDVNATCVEHQLCIVAPNIEKIPTQLADSDMNPSSNLAVTTSLNFGSMYHGQSKELEAYLFNNGPLKVPYSIRFIQGSEEDAESEQFITSTPQELAKLELRRVMKVEPQVGEVEPYSKIPLKFNCFSKVMEKCKGFVHNMMEENHHEMSSSEIVDNVIDYYYTAIFNFEGKFPGKLFLQLQARAVLPNLRISHNAIFFPPCAVNEQRDFLVKLENVNEELPIDFSFDKVAQFSVDPVKGTLLPLQTKSLTFTFTPKNLGVFHASINLQLINASYKMPIHLYAKCTGISEKTKPLRGPESLPDHFAPSRKYVSEEDIQNSQQLQVTQSKSPSDFVVQDYSAQVEQAILKQAVRQTYIDFLRSSRQSRKIEEKKAALSKKNRSLPRTLEEIQKDPDLGMRNDIVKGKELQLPQAADQLFVKKPIGIYEGGIGPQHSYDPDRPHKNVFKRPVDRKKFEEIPFGKIPSKQVEVRECSKILTPEELQFISAGPKIIKFDRVVVCSTVSKWFSVSNDLKQPIFVKLVSNIAEISSIEPSSLVIPAGLTGGFKLSLMSVKNQLLEGNVSYIINDQHHFNFKIEARVEPAVLKLSKTSIKFTFEDDNMEECLTEKLIIDNLCNADTKFSWLIPPNSNFDVEPREDIVEANKTKLVYVKFTPSAGGLKGDEELTMKVQNGEACSLKCKGEFTEAKCAFVQKNVDFETVAIGLYHEKNVTIKNLLRNTAVFHVKRCPPEVNVMPSRGKLSADGRTNLKVEFISQRPQELNGEIEVIVRGGKSLILPVHALAIIPNVYVKEEEIDFGGITYKTSSFRDFTIVNASPIPSILYINLEEHPEFEVSLHPDRVAMGEYESTVLVPATSDKLNPFSLKDEEEEMDDLKMAINDEDDSEEEVEEVSRVFKVSINPESSVTLVLKFTPADTEAYLFDLPILMAGVNEPNKMLTRPVSGEGLQPRFLVDPVEINFDKKYLNMGEKSFPDFKDIVFSNPDIYPLKWRIDSKKIDEEKVFTFKPTEGSLEPAASTTVRVSFNPNQAIDYEERIPVYLDDSPEPYLLYVLKGEGAIPRISFDRRHVMLPIVPLGIPAKSTFKIINQGYQNVELKYKLPRDPGKLPISIEFPEGQSLGSAKSRIPVEVSFISDKPISFTAILDFLDEEGNKFSIPIAGTADNSLFTVFSFIQTHADFLKLELDENGAIKLIHEENSENEEISGRWGTIGGPKTSAPSSVVSRSAFSIVGYSPIPIVLLEKGLEHLARFLNQFLSNTTISKFPDDMITQNGAPLYEFIYFMTGRNPPGMIKNIHAVNSKELARLLYKQYEDLITFLKSQGALLNTIRAEYLLSQNDFAKYLKSTPMELQLRPKQIQHRWPYLSMDSWTNLVYQVLKIYLLNRVNPRNFKSLPGMDSSQADIDASMTSSNIYSISETILLKWLNYHYSVIFPQSPRKVTNFDKDLNDGIVLAAVIQNHVGQIRSLANLKVNINSEDQRYSNCEKVISALNEIGMPTYFTSTDLARPQGRECLLFVLALYQGLPHYIPKAKIVFPCTLGEKVVKNIELTNPSANKSVSYWVKLEGSADYSVDGTEYITLSPNSSVSFPVSFQSRVTNPPQTAKLSFTHRPFEGSAIASALVFQLVSNVHSRVSQATYEIETPLYKAVQKEIEVKNIYPQDAEFSIQIFQKEKPAEPSKDKRRKTASTEPPALKFPNPFFIKNDKIKVKKNSSTYVGVQFIPLEYDTQTADIVFIDERVGEVQYTVIGKATLPESVEMPPIKADMGDTIAVQIPLDPKNKQLELAKAKIKERYQSSQKTKERDALNEVLKKLQYEESTVYEVFSNSPFFTAPSTISISEFGKMKRTNLDASLGTEQSKMESTNKTIKTPTKMSRGSIQESSIGNTLQLSCNPRAPGEYIGQVTLQSLRKTDIRVYEFALHVKPKRTVVTLEMSAHARQEIKQEIPIVNNSSRDWLCKVHFTQDGNEFSVSKDFTIRKESTNYCVVTFKPAWVCDVKGKLTLEIPQTGEAHELNLRGIGEEPRAEDHIVISCKVKEASHHSIPVPNPSDTPVTYRVESDLLNASGDATITVPARSTGKYEFTMFPNQSGSYTGSITFFNPQQHFYWYTIEVNSGEPEPEEEKILMTQCRKAVELKLTVFNPSDENTTFQVLIRGPGLLGDNLFYVPAKETGTYELLYSPLLPGEAEGAVSFVSDRTGEFWYKLKLVALPPEPIDLEMFECELGRSATQIVGIENPTNEEVILDYSCTNPLNFELNPEKVILPPYEVVEIALKYSPSSLKNIEKGEIKLTSTKLGDWVFKLKGKGLPPTEMNSIDISAAVGESNSIQIPFKNPFRENINIEVQILGEEVFQLLVRKNKFSVLPLGTLMIPIAYQPNSMLEHRGYLVVSITEDLTWKYPLRGITEKPSAHVDFVFKTKCRTSLEKTIEVYLTDLQYLAEEENFSHEIRVPSFELQGLVDKSFQIEPIKNIIHNPSEPLLFSVRFEPLRPYRTTVELLVYKSSGGRWKYNVLLDAMEPEEDDTIIIESQMNKTASVAFKLTNQFKAFAEFDAKFTPDSDVTFSVSPSHGILEPYGREGTTIIVSFTPTEYGAPKTGKLLIQTDEMLWSYKLIGRHPSYKVPEPEGGRLDNKLVRDPLASNQRKNYIRNNIKNLSPSRSGANLASRSKAELQSKSKYESSSRLRK